MSASLAAVAAVDLVAIARAAGAYIRSDGGLATTLTISCRVGVEGPAAKATNGGRRLRRRIGKWRLRVNWSLPTGGKTYQRAIAA